MELTGFTPRENDSGDRLPAKEAVDKPLIVLVREHRTGIKTKFNSDPNQPGYKPEGGDGVVLDVADIAGDSVWCNVLWMNGAVSDGLSPYVGQALPVKLVWTGSAKGGYPYLSVQALDGTELQAAQQWASNNPNRFDAERAQRDSGQSTQNDAPAAAPATVAQQQPTTQAPAPATESATGQQPADPNDPAVQALLAQINGGQQNQG